MTRGRSGAATAGNAARNALHAVDGDGAPAPPRSHEPPAALRERRRRAASDEVLREVAADLFAGAPGLDGALERVTAAARRALQAERATCYTSMSDDLITNVHTTERDPDRRALINDAVGRGPDELPLWAALRSQPRAVTAVPDTSRSRFISARLARRMGAGALLVIRLARPEGGSDETELGFLFLSWSSPRLIPSSERRLALAFSALAAPALAEARLRESRERAIRLAASAQRLGRLGVWKWDVPSGHVAYSDEACRIMGMPPGGDMTPERYTEQFLDPDDRAAGAVLLAELLAGERESFEIRQRLRRPDGRLLHVLVRAEVNDRDADGAPLDIAGVLQDITDLVEAEVRIRRSEAELAEAQRLASLGNWTLEVETERSTWSEEAFRIWGLPPTDEVDPATILARVHPGDRERVERTRADAVRTGRSMDLSYRVVRPDGTERRVHCRGKRVASDDAGRATRYFGTFHDVTDRARREEELRLSEMSNRHLAGEQAALRRVAVAVAQGDTPEAVFELVAREVADFLGVEAGLVWRFEGERSTAVGVWGDHRSSLGAAFPLEGGGALPQVRRTGRAAGVRYADLEAGDPTGSRLRDDGYRGGVAAPVTIGGALWGAILAATTTDREFTADDRAGLERFAELVALAIANAEARAELVALAANDPLTGLANHRTVHEAIQTEVARAQRHDRPFALALFDLDHFKEVNDTHGHQGGDVALLGLAALMSEAAREGDLVGRIGGEEFAWLMPETEAVGAYEAAERLRALVAATPLAPGIPVTVSAGVCDLDHAASATELVALADGALYWSKAHGRNIVFAHTPELVEPRSSGRQVRRLERTRSLTGLRVLARAVDAKDSSTQRHSERVAELAARIATDLGWNPRRVAELRDAALVHDVGKIGVPDAILFKPDRLTWVEYERVKGHAALGAEIAAEILSPDQVAWVRGHHEWWNGRGYPDGLCGDEIPEGARILALADALDAMTGSRPYQSGVTWAEALAECALRSSTQFDPGLARSAGLVRESEPVVPAPA